MPVATVTQMPARKAPREVRRQQLIEATIDTLAKHGYAATTLADVARTAGLSGGIINFHFESKEKLFVETLKYLAEEYRTSWQQAVAKAGQKPSERLAALVTSDFHSDVCTPRKLAAWGAFWAEAQSRPIYLEYCGSNDEEYSRIILDLCTSIIAEGKYTHSPLRVARALDAVLEGMWLDLMTMSKPYSNKEAIDTINTCLEAFFPRHFPIPQSTRRSK